MKSDWVNSPWIFRISINILVDLPLQESINCWLILKGFYPWFFIPHRRNEVRGFKSLFLNTGFGFRGMLLVSKVLESSKTKSLFNSVPGRICCLFSFSGSMLCLFCPMMQAEGFLSHVLRIHQCRWKFHQRAGNARPVILALIARWILFDFYRLRRTRSTTLVWVRLFALSTILISSL